MYGNYLSRIHNLSDIHLSDLVIPLFQVYSFPEVEHSVYFMSIERTPNNPEPIIYLSRSLMMTAQNFSGNAL